MRSGVLITVLVIATFAVSLEARDLPQDGAKQSHANMLGTRLNREDPFLVPTEDNGRSPLCVSNVACVPCSGLQTWCQTCKATAELLATQFISASSGSVAAGESLVHYCSAVTGNAREACEMMISSIDNLLTPSLGEGIGASLSKGEGFLKPSCNILPQCPKATNEERISYSRNTIFDFFCRQCKAIAGRFFGEVDTVVTHLELAQYVRPFCRAISLLLDPERCVETVVASFEQVYHEETVILNPSTLCFAYGACALATPSPPSYKITK